jgi:hypothetical protein
MPQATPWRRKCRGIWREESQAKPPIARRGRPRTGNPATRPARGAQKGQPLLCVCVSVCLCVGMLVYACRQACNYMHVCMHLGLTSPSVQPELGGTVPFSIARVTSTASDGASNVTLAIKFTSSPVGARNAMHRTNRLTFGAIVTLAASD